MVIEPDGVRHVLKNDRTAWVIDTPGPGEFNAGTVPGAQNVRAGEVHTAKNDGRLPMQDHNARIIVFGSSGEQARAVAEELTRNAFHNVNYYDGSWAEFQRVVSAAGSTAD